MVQMVDVWNAFTTPQIFTIDVVYFKWLCIVTSFKNILKKPQVSVV